MSDSQGILVLIAPTAIEEDMVDFLLGREHPQGFSSQRISGHSSIHEGLSTLEQVTGRQQHVRFEIQIAREDADEILQRLQESFKGVGIHYWFVPVINFGHID
jgi:hypothetical protein